MSAKNDFVTPIGFEMARELSTEETSLVGGGRAKQTAGGKLTGSTNDWDAEVHYDVEW